MNWFSLINIGRYSTTPLSGIQLLLGQTPRRTYMNMDTNEICGTLRFPSNTTIIVRPDFSIRVRPSRYKMDGTVVAYKAWKFSTEGKEAASRGLGFNEDPRDFFKLFGPTWSWFSGFKGQIALCDSDPKLKMVRDAIVFEQSEDEDGLEYYIRSPFLDHNLDHIESFSEIIAPLKTGFNPTLIRSLRAPELTLSRQIDVEYTDLKGVYLPSKVHYVDYDKDGNITMEKRYTFKDMKINESIPESTFSEYNIGLLEGDRMVDKINNKTFVYKKGTLVDIASTASESNDK